MHMRLCVSMVVLSLLLSHTMATGEGVTVVKSLPGNQGPGWKASIDAAGAVGVEHVVSFDVVGFVARDKASGEERQRFSAAEFWRNVEPVGSLIPQANANDSRIVYDPLSERWFCNGHPDLLQPVNCYVLPKKDAIAERGPVLDNAQTFSGLPLSTMPSLEFNPMKPADASFVLLAKEYADGTCGQLFLFRISCRVRKRLCRHLNPSG